MTTEAIIDRFVEALRQDGVRVESVSTAPWFSTFEASLPRRFPASYSSLFSRYRFPAFDRGGIRLFGNLGDESEEDLSEAAKMDPNLSKPALSAGLLQIGRPETGAYDPVCLDSRQMKNRREYPLVLLDHESLLQFERVVVVQKIDESFLSFMLHNGAAAYVPNS